MLYSRHLAFSYISYMHLRNCSLVLHAIIAYTRKTLLTFIIYTLYYILKRHIFIYLFIEMKYLAKNAIYLHLNAYIFIIEESIHIVIHAFTPNIGTALIESQPHNAKYKT